MNATEFARLMGVSTPAISKACANGRLSRSVTRDATGKVVSIDPILGREEFESSRSRISPHARRPAVEPVAVGLELHPDGADPSLAVKLPLGAFVRGIASGLRERGKEPTPDAIRAVLLAVDDEVWFTNTIGALLAATDEQISNAQISAMYERSGRAAVGNTKQ